MNTVKKGIRRDEVFFVQATANARRRPRAPGMLHHFQPIAASAQPTHAFEPAYGAFHYRAHLAQAVDIPSTASADARLHTQLPQQGAQAVIFVVTIGQNLNGKQVETSWLADDLRKMHDQRQKLIWTADQLVELGRDLCNRHLQVSTLRKNLR
jgi:hypothetical protein